MKKIISSLIAASFLVLPMMVLAVGELPTTVVEPTTTDVFTIATRIINLLFTVLLLAAAVFIVLAAYYFLTAGGDPGKVDAARNMVMYALIAIVVAALAKGLVWLVWQYILQGTTA